MSSVLICGAGMVAQPAVEYLSKHGFQILLGDLKRFERAKKMAEIFEDVNAIKLDVKDEVMMRKIVSDVEIVLSLVPPDLHYHVAKVCLEQGKNMVTASYSESIERRISNLEQKVENADIIILNEVGLDPGIDHMSAMKIINKIHSKDGKIISFRSYCGSLQHPNLKDVNPFKYKRSWAFESALDEIIRPAKYLENGKIVYINEKDLLNKCEILSIEDDRLSSFDGKFEVVPNRDSIKYIKKYGLENEVKTFFRGTLRFLGWSDSWKPLIYLGLLDEKIKINVGRDPILELYAKDLLLPLYIQKVRINDGEEDMVVMRHEIIYETKEGTREKIVSTLIDFGKYSEEMDTYTSIAKTTGLPAAICVRYILEGKINIKGLLIPTKKEIYNLVLKELEKYNIRFVEQRSEVK